MVFSMGRIGKFFKDDDVFIEVQNMFLYGLLDPTPNTIRLTPISKILTSENLSQFRPINLCNFSYEIISKILANRLKLLLPRLISPMQSTFVENRMIRDNILFIQEVVY